MPLVELTVANLAVLEHVRLPLARGFTVLTGETGAGKSLVVDALALALGARASGDQVRTGADGLRVDAVFEGVPSATDAPLDDLVGAEGGSAIIRREVGADGRSSARVNDRPVTVGALAALGSRLAEIHGQHEQQRLTESGHQLELLDRFGGNAITLVAEAWRAWRATIAAATELLTDDRELQRRRELLRHQVGEITVAALQPGEEGEVEAVLRVAQHAEAIVASANEASRGIRDEGAALDALRGALRALEAAAVHDDRFVPLVDRAHGVAAEAEELGRDAAALGESVDLDPASHAAAEERLTLIRDLERKYGASVEAVIAFGAEAASELERLDGAEGERERLRAEEGGRRHLLEMAAAELGAARRASAERLAAAVNGELEPLGLPAGSFGVAVDAGEIGPSGGDRVTFTFAPNPGEPPRPLARIASGGEASRLSLALKVVLAAADDTPLLVFDEVDAGIGGRHAAALGERLRALAAFHQVVCVTHLPQIAAFADAHLHVGKRVLDGRTQTELRVLEGEARARELAAMLAGADAGDEAHAAAEALLRASR